MASNVEIANRALQMLGAKRIVLLTDDSVAARACNVAFNPVRLAELRAHPWNFAIKRASLAASATPPAFGKNFAYPLPSDFVRLMPPDPKWNGDWLGWQGNWQSGNVNWLDWQIEGMEILTDDSAPLQIRYIADITDPNVMDPLFREAFSTELAFQLCEELTQSNTKKEGLRSDYKAIIAEARRANGFENIGQQPPEDIYVTVRG